MTPTNSTKTVPLSQSRLVRIRSHLIFWFSLLVLAGLAVWLRLDRVTDVRVSYDEAIHMIWLRLLAAGYRPYSEIYITYPPLYHASIEAVWQVWPTQLAQRWFSVAYAIFGAIGAALLARKIAGTLAGILAVFLVLFSPFLLKPSQEIMGEFHAVAWSVWAIWMIVLYQEATTPAKTWMFLILSSLFLSISLLIKLLSPFILPLILLVIVLRHQHEIFAAPPNFRPLLMETAVWGTILVLPALVLVFAVFDIGPLLQQVVDQRFLARAAYLVDNSSLTSPHEYAWSFFIKDKLLVVAGLLGLAVAGKYYRNYFWVLGGWLLLVSLFLMVHTPLRPKHFLVLIPVLAILGAIAGAKWLSSFVKRPWSLTSLAGLIVLMGLSIGQVSAVSEFRRDVPDNPDFTDDENQILAFIEDVTAPEDCIITDHAPILYWSDRMTPPELAEMSGNRLISGALDTDELIAITDKYDCPVIAPVANRLSQYKPDYIQWVENNYLGKVYYGYEPLFFAKADAKPQAVVPLWADFGGEISFQGFSLPEQAVATGERVPLALVWAASQSLDIDYTIFVQLRNEQGVTLVSADYQPYQTLLPTSQWPAGHALNTVTWLQLPDDLPARDYNIYVGVYRPDTLERLPLRDDTSGENALIIGPLQVR